MRATFLSWRVPRLLSLYLRSYICSLTPDAASVSLASNLSISRTGIIQQDLRYCSHEKEISALKFNWTSLGRYLEYCLDFPGDLKRVHVEIY